LTGIKVGAGPQWRNGYLGGRRGVRRRSGGSGQSLQGPGAAKQL